MKVRVQKKTLTSPALGSQKVLVSLKLGKQRIIEDIRCVMSESSRKEGGW